MLTFGRMSPESLPVAIANGGEYDDQFLYVTREEYRPEESEESEEETPAHGKRPALMWMERRKKPKDAREVYLRDGAFIPVPNPLNESNVYYICGPRGSGKTSLAVSIANVYNRMKPENRIFLFCETANSEQNQRIFGTLENLHVIPLDETLITQPLDLEELRDSMVIFDDVETLGKVEIEEFDGKKTKYRKYDLTTIIQELKDKIIQNGRHFNMDVLILAHMLFSYTKSRKVLEELNYLVFFNGATGATHVSRYLKNFLGLDAKQIQKITKQSSRWTLVSKSAPRYVLTEHRAFML